MSKASMARAIAKAGKKQEAQTRGLTGNRNAQGDFIAERPDLRTDGPSIPPGKHIDETLKSVEPDVQKYIEDVKAQIDDIDSQIAFARDAAEGPDAGMAEVNKITALETEKKRLLKDVVNRLDEEGIEIPPQIQQELDELSKVDEQPQDAALAAWDEMGGNTL